jgi:hypothetical protein
VCQRWLTGFAGEVVVPLFVCPYIISRSGRRGRLEQSILLTFLTVASPLRPTINNGSYPIVWYTNITK